MKLKGELSMRMRRKPWARPELDASEVYIKNPHDYYEKWQSAFDKEQPLVMELGCGKGGFIVQKAKENPILWYIEGKTSGPGHNMFFNDKDGNLICAYHIHTYLDRPSADRTVAFSPAEFVGEKLVINYK